MPWFTNDGRVFQSPPPLAQESRRPTRSLADFEKQFGLESSATGGHVGERPQSLQGGYGTQQPQQGGYGTQQPQQGGYGTQQPQQGACAAERNRKPA
jgi:hypothetical protein